MSTVAIVPKKQAYIQIRQMIFSDEIEPGSAMVERRLADKLEMSRVPVREALQRLVLEGILQYVPSQGLITRVYNEQEVLDLYHYREPLEGAAARLFTQRADDAEFHLIDRLYHGMEQQAADDNRIAFQNYDFEFHSAIARGSRNSRLVAELDDIYQECLYVSRSFFNRLTKDMKQQERKGMRQQILTEHKSIRDAVMSGKADHAETAARASIRGGIERFMKNIAGEKLRSLG